MAIGMKAFRGHALIRDAEEAPDYREISIFDRNRSFLKSRFLSLVV